MLPPPVHVPSLAVSVPSTLAVPLIVGGADAAGFAAGAAVPIATAARAAVATIASPASSERRERFGRRSRSTNRFI
jgi:hypothetical protein